MPADAAQAKSWPEWRTCKAASRCQRKTIPKLLADGLARPCCPLLPARKDTRSPGPPHEPRAPASWERPVHPAGRSRQAGPSSVSWWGHGGPGGNSALEHGWFSPVCGILSLEKQSVRRPADDGLEIDFPGVHRRDTGQGTSNMRADILPDLTLTAAPLP